MKSLPHEQTSDKTLAANPYHDRTLVTAITVNNAPRKDRAFAIVWLGQALDIRNIKVTQSSGHEPYIQLPEATSFGRPYLVVKTLDDRLLTAISEHVLAAWRVQIGFIGGQYEQR